MSYQPTGTIQDPEVRRELEELGRVLEELPRMRVMFREPIKPRDGLFCICDGLVWNPIGDGVKRPVWYDQTAAIWKVF